MHNLTLGRHTNQININIPPRRVLPTITRSSAMCENSSSWRPRWWLVKERGLGLMVWWRSKVVQCRILHVGERSQAQTPTYKLTTLTPLKDCNIPSFWVLHNQPTMKDRRNLKNPSVGYIFNENAQNTLP